MTRLFSGHSAVLVAAIAVVTGAAWSMHSVSSTASAAAVAVAMPQPPAKRVIVPAGGRAGGAFSPGILVGNTLYLTGQLGLAGRAEGVGGETKAAIESARKILQAAEMDLQDVVAVSAFLVDTADFRPFNEAYMTLFTAEPRPVRTTVFVKGLVSGAKVEVTMTAVKAR